MIDAVHLGSASHRWQLDCAVASVRVVGQALVLDHEISRRLVIVSPMASKPMRMLIVLIIYGVLLLEIVVDNIVVAPTIARFFLREDFAIEWTISSLHLLLSKCSHTLLLKAGDMILECDLLYTTSGLIQLRLLQVLGVRPHKVKPTSGVRIAAISVDAVSLRFAANELIGWFRTGHSLVGSIGVGHSPRCLYFA